MSDCSVRDSRRPPQGPTPGWCRCGLSDAALLDLIRPGDVVDVLAGDSSVAPGGSDDQRPRVVATNAIVVLVSKELTAPGRGDDRVVLIALPAHTANDVAAASLTQAVTLVLH